MLLLRADPRRRAMLLERLHPRDLTSIGDLEACEVVAGLYGRIHVPALPQLRTITSYVERWTADLAALPRDAPIPRRMREQCVSLARDLVADPASVGVIIHGDLHHHNVLAADREPWLVIDPKPMSGDPHYELAPMLWNRWDEIVGRATSATNLRRRFHTLVDAAGLDEDRARDWVVVRMVAQRLVGRHRRRPRRGVADHVLPDRQGGAGVSDPLPPTAALRARDGTGSTTPTGWSTTRALAPVLPAQPER